MFIKPFSSLKNQWKFNPSKPSIDNIVFKLHYKATVCFLLGCVLIICCKEYFGEQIHCIQGDKEEVPKVISTYCYIIGAFTIDRYFEEDQVVREDVVAPGVGPFSDLSKEKVLRYKYFQWVPYVLFLQAACFYLTHLVWKSMEGGRMKLLVDGLHQSHLAFGEEDFESKDIKIPSSKTLATRLNVVKRDVLLRLHCSGTWSIWLVSLEVINLLHVILQIWLTDMFLNGNFISLGLRLRSGTEHVGPFEKMFPLMTKCVYHKYGPSGSMQTLDALCVMSQAVVFEKSFVAMWFWFMILLIASSLAVAWRVLTIYHFKRHSWRFNARQLSHGHFGLEEDDVKRVLRDCQFADWLFLVYLGHNMEKRVFQKLFKEIADELRMEKTLPYKYNYIGFHNGYLDQTLPLKGTKLPSNSGNSQA